jgi:hypothetical protein
LIFIFIIKRHGFVMPCCQGDIAFLGLVTMSIAFRLCILVTLSYQDRLKLAAQLAQLAYVEDELVSRPVEE